MDKEQLLIILGLSLIILVIVYTQRCKKPSEAFEEVTVLPIDVPAAVPATCPPCPCASVAAPGEGVAAPSEDGEEFGQLEVYTKDGVTKDCRKQCKSKCVDAGMINEAKCKNRGGKQVKCKRPGNLKGKKNWTGRRCEKYNGKVELDKETNLPKDKCKCDKVLS